MVSSVSHTFSDSVCVYIKWVSFVSASLFSFKIYFNLEVKPKLFVCCCADGETLCQASQRYSARRYHIYAFKFQGCAKIPDFRWIIWGLINFQHPFREWLIHSSPCTPFFKSTQKRLGLYKDGNESSNA